MFRTIALLVTAATILTLPLLAITPEARHALEENTIVGEIAIRTTSTGYVIASQEEGTSRNFFFQTSSPPDYLAVRDSTGVLILGSGELRIVLPSEDLLLRLATGPLESGAKPWNEAARLRMLKTFRVGHLEEVRNGLELITYLPGLPGLEAAALLGYTDADFRDRLNQPRLFLDAIFQDGPDNPGDDSCKLSCSVKCLGGSSCSAECTGGRCATCKCEKDLPSCNCS